MTNVRQGISPRTICAVENNFNSIMLGLKRCSKIAGKKCNIMQKVEQWTHPPMSRRYNGFKYGPDYEPENSIVVFISPSSRNPKLVADHSQHLHCPAPSPRRCWAVEVFLVQMGVQIRRGSGNPLQRSCGYLAARVRNKFPSEYSIQIFVVF